MAAGVERISGAQVRAAHAAGVPVEVLVERHRISRARIIQFLTGAPKPARAGSRRAPLSFAEVDAAKRAYRAGDTFAELGERHGLSERGMRTLLKAVGVTPRPRGKRLTPLPVEMIVADAKGGLSAHAIAHKHGVNRHRVNAFLRERGLARQPQQRVLDPVGRAVTDLQARLRRRPPIVVVVSSHAERRPHGWTQAEAEAIAFELRANRVDRLPRGARCCSVFGLSLGRATSLGGLARAAFDLEVGAPAGLAWHKVFLAWLQQQLGSSSGTFGDLLRELSEQPGLRSRWRHALSSGVRLEAARLAIASPAPRQATLPMVAMIRPSQPGSAQPAPAGGRRRGSSSGRPVTPELLPWVAALAIGVAVFVAAVFGVRSAPDAEQERQERIEPPAA